ncbi:MAG: hypothetical protein JWO81_2302 [Alphaproteobacteria bacterium]|nr:hypothetical protein [Alphaproteobacteria bacterium]
MLDDVERRRLLVEPARKDPVELALGIGDVELNEGAGQLLDLPWRGRLAGAQPDDDVADAQRLARLEGQVPLNAVALVEQADHRHALVHRRRPRRFGRDGLRDVDGLRLGARLAVALPFRRALGAAGGDRRERGERRRDGQDGAGAAHLSSGVPALSGVQAS